MLHKMINPTDSLAYIITGAIIGIINFMTINAFITTIILLLTMIFWIRKNYLIWFGTNKQKDKQANDD